MPFFVFHYEILYHLPFFIRFRAKEDRSLIWLAGLADSRKAASQSNALINHQTNVLICIVPYKPGDPVARDFAGKGCTSGRAGRT